MEKQPLVSVCCLSYNHAPYIEQCLDGILMQKTTFPFEILIHDDASTDDTQSIIRRYEQQYPDVIKPIYQTENQYSKGVQISKTYNFSRAQGKYIAICEGDDYWIDSQKLQKQVDYLEAHPECGLVHTKAYVYIEKDNFFEPHTIGYMFDNVDQLIIENRISTLTTCFRSDLCRQYECAIMHSSSWKMGDYPLWIYIASQSKVYFLNETTAVYRKLESSVSHSKSLVRDIDFCYSVYCVSISFARLFEKIYLLPDIKSKFLSALVYSYAKKDARVDTVLLSWFIKTHCFMYKPYILLFLNCFKTGRKFLRRRIL